MSWWATHIVYVTPSALLLTPPGRIIYHFQTRMRFGQYVPDPEKPGTSKRVGTEKHRTACGLVTYDEEHRHPFRMDALRRDIAALLGRPCRSCERRAPA